MFLNESCFQREVEEWLWFGDSIISQLIFEPGRNFRLDLLLVDPYVAQQPIVDEHILEQHIVSPMKRLVVIYGLIGGILITVLQWTQYRFLVLEHSIEIYGTLVAAIFAVLGIWLGIKLTAKRPVTVIVKEVPVAAAAPGERFIPNERKQEDLGITRRELEILGLIAQGMSNREIADKLFVSENTVKTHSSRVFDKLGAKRRTQAVQFGKELGLLP